MIFKIRERISLAGQNANEYLSIYFSILNSELAYENKKVVLFELQQAAFMNGLDLRNLIIPKKKVEKPGKFTLGAQNNVVASVEKNTYTDFATFNKEEFFFISKQIELMRKNFPFLRTVVLKNDVQVMNFNSAVVCCREIDSKYLETYFEDGTNFIISNSFERINDIGARFIFIIIWPPDHKTNLDIKNKIKNIKNVQYLDEFAFEKEGPYWQSHTDYLDRYFDIDYERPLININLKIDEERLVRKLISCPTGFLTYRILGGGYTGAKVLEVSSVGNGNAKKKFVIKIDQKGKKYDSISQEHKNFKDHIENLPNDLNLSAHREESGLLEAIKYPFASINSINNSISFGKFFSKKDVSLEELRHVIISIFSDKLMKNWNSTAFTSEISGFDAFKKLDWQIESLSRVVDFQKKFKYSNNLDLEKIKQIFELKRKIVQSVAHGDLHVDNIQVDVETSSSKIFFIDFGRTGIEPLGLDYAQLECSIRYNLLDAAFSLQTLSAMDDKYFDTFSTLKIESGEDEVFKTQFVCSVIREQYLNNFPKKERDQAEEQYYLCLLAVSLWLIDKSNLNRPYIWNTLHRLKKYLSNYQKK